MNTKTTRSKPVENIDLAIEDKLKAMYELQMVDSEIDKIKILRGELPLEVRDLEDEIAGLETRIKNHEDEAKGLKTAISNKKNEIKESDALIKKYNAQQAKVRNNREYDSISKEIEFQSLEIQLSEKRIKEFTATMNEKKLMIEDATKVLKERKTDLEHKHADLEKINSETREKEEALLKKSRDVEKLIEPRLLTAYKRIRANAKNGLAVVSVERDACGGCHNKIPPQRQLDIRSGKKIIVCEYCGRILVDKNIRDKDKVEKKVEEIVNE